MPGPDLSFPNRIPLANTPTPLQFLSRASARWGNGKRLWVKRDDLTGCTLSGNKVRKLEFIAAHAIENGYDTLITCGGIQSNHCRATAFTGAQLGLPVHLVLRGLPTGDVPEGNLLMDHLAGATVNCYSTSEYVSGLAGILEHWRKHYEEQGRKALVIPTGGSDGIGVWGYLSAVQELAADFEQAGIRDADIVCATGSGGTQAGLTLGASLLDLQARVWGVNVCDDENYFLDKVAADVQDWAVRYQQSAPPGLSIRVLDGYVGKGYAKASPAIFELISELARTEGLVLDPVYTAKAFAGMLEELQAGRFADASDLVFIHTGGLFGLFPQANQFRW